MLNPAGTTPVLVEEAGPAGPGRRHHRRISRRDARRCAGRASAAAARTPATRIEVRRLLGWFNDKFFAEVTEPAGDGAGLQAPHAVDQGGGPPDTDAIRAARSNIRYHLAYIGWLVAHPRLACRRPADLRRSRGGGASVGDRLSGRRAMERRRSGEDLVRAGEVAPVVPAAAGGPLAGPAAVADLRRPRLLSDPPRSRPRSREAARDARLRRVRLRRARRRSRSAKARLARFLADGAHGDMGWMADDRRAARRSARDVAARCARSSCSA